jgi:hypothetical protein
MFCRNARITQALGATLLLAAASWSSAALAQAMVVRSTGPSAAKFPVGKKLAANERVTLVAGDQLVLIDKGKTRTIARPGTHNVSANLGANQTLTSTMTRMISRDGAMRSRGGFTRGPGDPAPTPAESRAPNLWLIDARVGGNFCVADPARLLIWRADMAGDALLRIEAGSDAGKAETLAFVDGQAYRRWPSDSLPLRFGEAYRLSVAGGTAPVSINFQPLEALPEAPEVIAELLLAKGCTGQLDRLVDAMSEEEGEGR